MNFASLRFRLVALSFLTIAAALLATGIALNDRFAKYFENRINAELAQHLEQLATSISLDDAQNIDVSQLPDRRFEQPFSGLYWQIIRKGSPAILSRSLWGKPISLSDSYLAGDRFNARSFSPTGTPVLVSGWVIVLGEADNAQQMVLSVAINQSEMQNAAEGFRSFLAKWLGVLLVGLMVAAWLQIGIGLAPLNHIRRKVEKVKNNANLRLSGQFPAEVQPLVDEVNTLLEAHELSLRSARAKASDLAHGLKTPLAIMRAILAEFQADNSAEKIEEMTMQISAMHRFIERELAQVRKNHLTTQHTLVEQGVQKMVASMKKLPRGAGIDWKIDIAEGLVIPLDDHDLAELLGNLLDNARKWAKGEITISGTKKNPNVGGLEISDDGHGVSVEDLKTLNSGGKIQETSTSGSGLGLAICHDLIGAVGGTIQFTRSRLGGLTVTLAWPVKL